MTYPHYIVQWHEGRLPCPPHLRCTVMRRQFESGRIGGKRLVEKETPDPAEARRLWEQDRHARNVYVVKAPDTHRVKVREPWSLRAVEEETSR